MCKTIIGLFVILSLWSCAESPEPGPPVVRGVNYVGVSVSDLESSTEFYSGAADLQLVENSVISDSPVMDALLGRTGVSAQTSLLKSSNAQLRFMQFDNRSTEANAAPKLEVHGPGIAHVCYQVAKKTNSYQRFLDAGAVHIGDRDMVQLNPKRPVDYAYARDADGIMFEVEHVDIAKLDLDTPPRYDYRIRQVSLATSDIDRAVKFYSALLDEKSPRRLGRLFSLSGEKLDKVSGLAGTKLEMAFFQVRNTELEIIQYVSHPTTTPETARPVDALGYNMIVFDVVDVDAAREKLINAGGTVVGDVKPMDGGQILFGRDPDGNLLGFQAVSSEAVFSSQQFKDNGI